MGNMGDKKQPSQIARKQAAKEGGGGSWSPGYFTDNETSEDLGTIADERDKRYLEKINKEGSVSGRFAGTER